MIRAVGVSKSFGAIHALRDVTFDAQRGEVHALVGENGAGKSTLIKILTGALEPDVGTVERAGAVAAVYQQPALFGELSVAENIALLTERDSRRWLVDWSLREANARRALARIGAEIDPKRLANTLSLPEQQMVEIAKAVATDARTVVFDEPTASLPEADSARLFDVVAELKAQGRALIYISHRLEELFRIADRVTVLRDGRRIATNAIGEATRASLIGLMAGRDVDTMVPARETKAGEIRLRAPGLEVRAGEIVGLAGLVGAGRTELARRLFAEGAAALVPEDRRRNGVIGPMPVSDNVGLAALKTFLVDRVAERRSAESFRERLSIKCASVDAPVETLSGGNQQKVALARWLATNPGALILDEPTQGVDVGAKAEIYRLIAGLADGGMAVLLISSELPELLGLCDRIAVMRRGAIVATFHRSEAEPSRILEAMLGAAA
jgi:rhamnose transport system ATP-binding protein